LPARVAKELEGLDISVLVNNVRRGYRYPRFFHKLGNEEVSGMVEMNVDSVVWMTKKVSNSMAERKRGAIIYLLSGSDEHTMPLLAVYGAAKMFVERFSQSLNAKYRGRGVRVQCQIPFYVTAKLAKLRKSLTVPTVEAYVWMSMRWVG
jgi:17beta-estradiol 17-dehydrogenase / very-long-chain 3-oxoacyl-CoA reductase